MRCPHCGEESFAKKKKITENWKVVGEIQVCALCGKKWGKNASGGTAGKASDGNNKSRLAALLGGDLTEKVELAGSVDRKFCRNCRYFLVHPFKTVCSLTDTEADPMGECGQFEERAAVQKPS